MSSAAGTSSTHATIPIRLEWLSEFVRFPKQDKKVFSSLTNAFQKELSRQIGVSCFDGGSKRKHTFVQSDSPDTDTVVKFPLSYDLKSPIEQWCSAKSWRLQMPNDAKDFVTPPAETEAARFQSLVPFQLAIRIQTGIRAMLANHDFRKMLEQHGSITDVTIHKRCVRFAVGAMSFDFVPAVSVSHNNRNVQDAVLVPFCMDSQEPYDGNSVSWRLNFPECNLRSLRHLTTAYGTLAPLHIIQLLKWLNGRHDWGITSYALECLVVMKEALKPWAFQFYFKESPSSFNDQFWFVFDILERSILQGELPHQHTTLENFASSAECGAISAKLKLFREGAKSCCSQDQLKVFLQQGLQQGQLTQARSSAVSPTQHPGVRCDGCKERPLIGDRWKCKLCADFDFCSKCHATQGHSHQQSHLQTSSDGWLRNPCNV